MASYTISYDSRKVGNFEGESNKLAFFEWKVNEINSFEWKIVKLVDTFEWKVDNFEWKCSNLATFETIKQQACSFNGKLGSMTVSNEKVES